MSVYFAKAGPYMKVGYSTKPLNRVSTITRTGTRPDDLPFGTKAQLFGWIPGDQMREMALLVRFADRRVAGEWHVIDEPEVREIIWSDPAGIDVQRMSALAVFAAARLPGVTREELSQQGLPIEATDPAEGLVNLGRKFGEVVR